MRNNSARSFDFSVCLRLKSLVTVSYVNVVYQFFSYMRLRPLDNSHCLISVIFGIGIYVMGSMARETFKGLNGK